MDNVVELRPLIDVREVSGMLGVTPRTIWRLRDLGKMPMPVKIGGSVRWRRMEILSWIEQGCPKLRRAAR